MNTKRRNHCEHDHGQIEQYDQGLADGVGSKASQARKQRAEEKPHSHGNLKEQSHVGVVRSHGFQESFLSTTSEGQLRKHGSERKNLSRSHELDRLGVRRRISDLALSVLLQYQGCLAVKWSNAPLDRERSLAAKRSSRALSR